MKNVAVEIRRAQIGFIRFGGIPGGATNYFFNTSDPLYLTTKVLYVTQTLIGDMFIVSILLALVKTHRFGIIADIQTVYSLGQK